MNIITALRISRWFFLSNFKVENFGYADQSLEDFDLFDKALNFFRGNLWLAATLDQIIDFLQYDFDVFDMVKNEMILFFNLLDTKSQWLPGLI